MKDFDDNNIYESEEDDEDYDDFDDEDDDFDDEDDDFDDEEDDGYIFQLDETLEINKKHELEFSEIVESNKPVYDPYWDINDPFVRLILGILFGIGAIGSIYYITMWILG